VPRGLYVIRVLIGLTLGKAYKQAYLTSLTYSLSSHTSLNLTGTTYSPIYVIARACEWPISRSPLKRSSLFLWHPLSTPLPVRGLLLTAPLPLTRFSASTQASIPVEWRMGPQRSLCLPDNMNSLQWKPPSLVCQWNLLRDGFLGLLQLVLDWINRFAKPENVKRSVRSLDLGRVIPNGTWL